MSTLVSRCLGFNQPVYTDNEDQLAGLPDPDRPAIRSLSESGGLGVGEGEKYIEGICVESVRCHGGHLPVYIQTDKQSYT